MVMDVSILHSTLSPAPSLLFPFNAVPACSHLLSKIRLKNRLASASKSVASPLMNPHQKFRDFPHVSGPVKDLMLDLVSSVETHLGNSLLPCTLPPDVQYYQNQTPTAEGTLFVRSGIPSSLVDLILGSWLHCKLPSGGALSITSFTTHLKPLTDAPNFVIEIIQSSPTGLALILDMPPRKDLVLYPEYLKTFYEDTELDRQRQLLEKLPEVTPYFPSLYARALVAPSAILVRIEAETDKTSRIDEIIQDHVRPAANEIMKIWLDLCASVGREVGEAEMGYLLKRDQVARSKTVDMDLCNNLPRLAGEEVAARIVEALRGTFHV